MNQSVISPAGDADDLFLDEIEDTATERLTWKVLIADDDLDVHVATKLVLREFRFKERTIEFIDAYSGHEACEVLRKNPDTAVIFLDVVMETEDAGLNTVKRIRDELDNQMVRIILRTGQPGSAPEEHVVVNYHINDYKSKSEMTAQKLFTSLVSALRSYQDLQTIEASRRGLVKVLDAAGSMDFRSRNLFVSGLLMQLGSLLDTGDDDLVLIRRGESGGHNHILAACGSFDPFIGEFVQDVFDAESVRHIDQVFSSRAAYTDTKRTIYPVPLPELADAAVYVGGARTFNQVELALMTMFCQKISLAVENYDAVEQSRANQTIELALLAKLTGNANYLPVSYVINRGRLSRDMAAKLKEMGIAEASANHLPDVIERAVMLADIGNHGISSAILESAGGLSAEDRALVRKHPEFGAELIDGILANLTGGRVISLARQITLSHHESFDGTGYPHQLAGSAIPLPARIASVADSYMALTSARPWRDARSHEDAVAAIRQGSGGRYDPQVVEAFLAVADAYQGRA